MLLELVSGVVGPERNGRHRGEPRSARQAPSSPTSWPTIQPSSGQAVARNCVGERRLGRDHHAGVGLQWHALLAERGRRLVDERLEVGRDDDVDRGRRVVLRERRVPRLRQRGDVGVGRAASRERGGGIGAAPLEGAEVGVGDHVALALELRRPRPRTRRRTRAGRRSTRSPRGAPPAPGRAAAPACTSSCHEPPNRLHAEQNASSLSSPGTPVSTTARRRRRRGRAVERIGAADDLGAATARAACRTESSARRQRRSTTAAGHVVASRRRRRHRSRRRRARPAPPPPPRASLEPPRGPSWHATCDAERHAPSDPARLRPRPRRRGGDHRRRPLRRAGGHHHGRRKCAARPHDVQRLRRCATCSG